MPLPMADIMVIPDMETTMVMDITAITAMGITIVAIMDMVPATTGMDIRTIIAEGMAIVGIIIMDTDMGIVIKVATNHPCSGLLY